MKKWLIIAGVAIVCSIGGVVWTIQAEKAHQREAQQAFVKQLEMSLQQQDFAAFTGLATVQSLEKYKFTQQTLIEKYEKIFTGIGVENVKISNSEFSETEASYSLQYQLSMSTVLGEIETIPYEVDVVLEDETYQMNWTPALIFPGMMADDVVKYTVEQPVRGVIKDRNGVNLAENGTAKEMGIVPGNLGEGDERTANLQTIADTFEVSVETLEKALSQSWVKPDQFVPIKVVAETPVLPGVMYGNKTVRYYQLGEAAAHLVGYTGAVTAEDLEKNPSLPATGIIGKTGLERTYDAELRGTPGGEIYLAAADGTKKHTLLMQEKQEGKDVQLTLDALLQQQAYSALKEASGSTVVTNPTTGELLALASKPSYDPNLMVRGISQAKYDAYANDERLPFVSRFTSRYAPGSTFKPITVAIELEQGTLIPTDTHAINGVQWQQDASWGNYYVTRVTNVASVDMTDALVYSDNIYIAQETLELGVTDYVAGLEKLIFARKFDLPLAMEQAQISNDGIIDTEILLADTSYGQGELLMSPIHMATLYSVFANAGTLSMPSLILGETAEQQQIFTAEIMSTVEDALKQVVTSPNGTAHSLNGVGPIAAKTGTTELKQQQGARGMENSLVFVYNTEQPDYLVLSLVEDHVAVGQTATQLVKPLLQYLENGKIVE